MSREIKFRIMYKKYPNIWLKDEYTLRGLIEMDGAGFLGDDDIIEPCTGLKDKNGKEIYEGDICRLIYSEKRDKKRWKKVSESISVIEFEDGYFKFSDVDQYGIRSELVFSDYVGEWFTEIGQYKYVAEVIGNIHENPELLGVKDGQA